MNLEQQKRILKEVIRKKDVRALVKAKWGYDLTPGQAEIVRIIAFREHRRVSVCAMTRYGKTLCVALGVALLIDMDMPLKIAFIGPKQDQAAILRQYLAELIFKDPSLLSKAQLTAIGDYRLLKEATKKRMTFSNGAEYRVFSAEGEADRLMGFGASVVVKDESSLINRTAHAKIMRMLGDDPEKGILIELYNPWDTDNITYEHTFDPNFKFIHIGWEQAVQEGRTTLEFIEQQRKELTPLQFRVLYESQFPDISEDSIFHLQWYEQAIKQEFSLWRDFRGLHEKKKQLEGELAGILSPAQQKQKKQELKEVLEELALYKLRIACDPADKGIDWTVILWGIIYGDQYQMLGYYSEATSDNMAIASKIIEIFHSTGAHEAHIDGHGLGVGVISRLKQIRKEQQLNLNIKECLFGNAAIHPNLYRNMKAENYFNLRRIMKDGLIQLQHIPELKQDIMRMKWERQNEKTTIVDPEKSPDFSDALIYFVWKDRKSISFF